MVFWGKKSLSPAHCGMRMYGRSLSLPVVALKNRPVPVMWPPLPMALAQVPQLLT